MNKTIIISIICAISPLFTAFPQEKAIKNAEKLIGIDGKTEEARTHITKAMADSITTNKAKTWYVAANIEEEYFHNEYHKLSVNPKDSRVNKTAMSQALLDAYKYYLKALSLDTTINKKGKIKTKYSNDIRQRVKKLYDDKLYIWVASHLTSEKKYYPLAHEAFVIQADIPGMAMFDKDKNMQTIPDSIRGLSYFNAGISAWSGGELQLGANMFRKARKYNYTKKEAFMYEIACYQAIAQKDTNNISTAEKNMIQIARDGYEVYGTDIPLFINLYIRGLVSDQQFELALELLNEEIEKDPENGILYKYRAYVYDQNKNDENSVNDYIKAAELTPEYETLIEASRKIAMVGDKKRRNLNYSEPNITQIKNDILTNYYQIALKYANKAKEINPDNPDSDIIIENIKYSMGSL